MFPRWKQFVVVVVTLLVKQGSVGSPMQTSYLYESLLECQLGGRHACGESARPELREVMSPS